MTAPTTLAPTTRLPAPDLIEVERDVSLSDTITFDLYRPRARAPCPVVILALGYADHGARMMFGKSLEQLNAADRFVAAALTPGEFPELLGGPTLAAREPSERRQHHYR